tara:strand:+ start:13751 stop:14455 length:705 start_codon:yes stop_codon:yes gene_type:complete
MYLANAFKLKNKVATAFDMASISGLKAWYKFKTDVSVDGDGNVSLWADSSGNTSEDMDVAPARAHMDVPYNASTGAHTFTNANASELFVSSGDQLNLGTFTIFGAVDVIESGASNESVLGRAGNDEFRLFRGSNAAHVRLRANGVNYDINMSEDLPTGKFLYTLIRETSGDLEIKINGVSKGTVSTTITDLFDFQKIGNTQTDCIVYEIAIYDNELSLADMQAVEADITARTGI